MSTMNRSKHADPLDSSMKARKSGSAKRPGGSGGDGGDMIVTRGLQEILQKEQIKARANAASTPKAKVAAAPGRRSTGPKFVVCYLCGRQFGSSSIDIHRPQCYLKMMIAWERADPALRGAKPVDPDTHEKQIKERLAAQKSASPRGDRIATGNRNNNTNSQLDAYNQAQADAYASALSPCPNCGRTFLPDRLQVHLRSCKPGASSKPVQSRASRSQPGTAAAAAGNDQAAQQSSEGTAPSQQRQVEDQPIKASGVYRVPDDADTHAIPPGAKSKSPSASRNSKADNEPSRGREGSCQNAAEEQPARKSASPIAVCPEGAEDEPAAKEAGDAAHLPVSEGGTPPMRSPLQRGIKTRSPSHRATHSNKQHASVLVLSKSQAQEDGDDNSEAGAEARDASERRLSAALEAEEDNGNSAPQRHASVDPSLVESRKSANASNNASQRGPVTPPIRAAAATASGAPSGGAGAGDDEDAVDGDDANGVDASGKKIQLNNVSRFKNVQSRLMLDKKQNKVDLVPCRHCGRTFNPLRIVRHEECCIERNNAPATMTRAPKSPAAGKKPSAKKANAATIPMSPTEGSPRAAPRFCGDCGTRCMNTDQKFCKTCGTQM